MCLPSPNHRTLFCLALAAFPVLLPPKARAGWIYTFPIGQQMKIFQMPAPGYLAFPVYALECFAMYVYGAWLLSPKYVAEKKYQE